MSLKRRQTLIYYLGTLTPHFQKWKDNSDKTNQQALELNFILDQMEQTSSTKKNSIQ